LEALLKSDASVEAALIADCRTEALDGLAWSALRELKKESISEPRVVEIAEVELEVRLKTDCSWVRAALSAELDDSSCVCC
jgi:hypothetical protein